MAKQFGAGVFAKFDDVFERVGLPVIRIGDALLIGVSREEIGEEHDFVHQRFVGTKCAQSAEVVGIHGHDAVEGFEIFGLHGARTVGESIAVCFGVPPHAHIGELALVVVDHAGGINARKFGRTTGTLHALAENFLGNGRTTDVAETNEENIHEQMGWLRSAKIEISV